MLFGEDSKTSQSFAATSEERPVNQFKLCKTFLNRKCSRVMQHEIQMAPAFHDVQHDPSVQQSTKCHHPILSPHRDLCLNKRHQFNFTSVIEDWTVTQISYRQVRGYFADSSNAAFCSIWNLTMTRLSN